MLYKKRALDWERLANGYERASAGLWTWMVGPVEGGAMVVIVRRGPESDAPTIWAAPDVAAGKAAAEADWQRRDVPGLAECVIAPPYLAWEEDNEGFGPRYTASSPFGNYEVEMDAETTRWQGTWAGGEMITMGHFEAAGARRECEENWCRRWRKAMQLAGV